jgi:hypothetical protein
VLPADGAFFAFFEPPEDTVGVKFMSAVQHVLLALYFNVAETDWALEGFLVKDGLAPVFLPDRVDDVLVSTAASAPSRAAGDHTHDSAFTFAILAFHLSF